jgi:hypothetical protein
MIIIWGGAHGYAWCEDTYYKWGIPYIFLGGWETTSKYPRIFKIGKEYNIIYNTLDATVVYMFYFISVHPNDQYSPRTQSIVYPPKETSIPITPPRRLQRNLSTASINSVRHHKLPNLECSSNFAIYTSFVLNCTWLFTCTSPSTFSTAFKSTCERLRPFCVLSSLSDSDIPTTSS